ncbi:hypothetical protein [Prosthecobacter sp.]|uniref:hypothetical protein n=1 Tax=Prosthecobacter sp. TaxID=1965333 RepID=UPI0024888FE5|nr:hypothetical protein [Prosthecobacter sp.]MDI1310927.1 hypothetical protein [Prosthecobacter sp.]
MKLLRQHRKLLGWFMTCLMAVWLPGPYAHAAMGTWIEDESGTLTWQDFTHWNDGLIPGFAIGDTANLNLNFLGNQFISLNDPLTLGTLNIGDVSGGSNLVLTAGVNGTLSFNNDGLAVINKTGEGTVAIMANVGLQNQLTLNIAQGILVLGGVVDGVNGFTKNGDGTLVLRNANNFTGVNILNGGITMISPGGQRFDGAWRVEQLPAGHHREFGRDAGIQ